MSRLSPAQLAAAAHRAGFRGNALVEIVAIAMAESGGNARALNPRGEYSVGLTQINMRAHGSRFGTERQLYDPVTNFRAAYQLSRGGKNFRPWSVHRSSPSPHAGSSNRHLATARRAVGSMSGVDPASLKIPLTGMPDTSAAKATFGNLPDFAASQAAQQAAMEEERKRQAHHDKIMQVMNLLQAQQQSRNRPISSRPAVQVSADQFSQAPFKDRLQGLSRVFGDLTPGVARRKVGGDLQSRSALLGAFGQMIEERSARGIGGGPAKVEDPGIQQRLRALTGR